MAHLLLSADFAGAVSAPQLSTKNSHEQITKKLTKPASGHSFKWEWAGGTAGFNEESVTQSVQSLKIITALPLPLGHLASASLYWPWALGRGSHMEDSSLVCFIQVAIVSCESQC